VPGAGYRIVEKSAGRALIVNLLGSTFMGEDVDNAFIRIDRLLADMDARSERFDAIVVDYHRETTSELALMGEYLRGRVSLLYGTHTHVQTNDERILGGHTGVITDIGATGALDSAIGATYASFMPSALTGVRFFGAKQEVDLGRGVVCALFAEIEGGVCRSIEKIRIVEPVE
jgi:2',3'-cyclic-nucleotide 2'-phosphodiesterase